MVALPRSRSGLVLLAGVVALVAYRLWLLAGADSIIVYDEIGYLGNARHLAGAEPDVLMAGAFYRAGYSLLLVPLAAGLDDPTSLHTAGVALNVVLVALTPLLAYVLARRGFALERTPALVGALVAALYPTLTGFAAALWSESLLPVLFLAWAIGLVHLRADRPVWWSALFGAAGAALYMTHSRMIGVAGLTVVLVVLAAGTRRVDLPRAAVGLAAAAVVTVGGVLLNGVLLDAVYVAGDGQGSALVGRLDAADARPYAITAAGQLWYLVLVTMGTVVAGVWVALRDAWVGRRTLLGAGREHVPAEGRPDPLVASGLLVGAATVFVVSATSLGTGVARLFDGASQNFRADLVVYGRYNEAVVLPFVALGVAWLLDRVSRREAVWVLGATVALLLTGAAALRLEVPEAWRAWYFEPSTSSGVFAWIEWVGSFSVLRITAIGLALVVTVVLTAHAARIGVVAVTLVAAVFLSQSHVVADEFVTRYTNHAKTINGVPLALNELGVDRVGFVAPYEGAAYYLFQFWLTDAEYELVGDGSELPVGLEAVIAPTSWSAAAAHGARAVAVDDTLDYALWVVDETDG